jgi:hypothetical protein
MEVEDTPFSSDAGGDSSLLVGDTSITYDDTLAGGASPGVSNIPTCPVCWVNDSVFKTLNDVSARKIAKQTKLSEKVINTLRGSLPEKKQDHKPSVWQLWKSIAADVERALCGDDDVDAEEEKAEDVPAALNIVSNIRCAVDAVSHYGRNDEFQRHVLTNLAVMASGPNVTKKCIEDTLGMSRRIADLGRAGRIEFDVIARNAELEANGDQPPMVSSVSIFFCVFTYALTFSTCMSTLQYCT